MVKPSCNTASTTRSKRRISAQAERPKTSRISACDSRRWFHPARAKLIAPTKQFESPILDANGQAFKRTPKPRQELGEALAAQARNRRDVHAAYDAAQTTDSHKNHWANADSYDADSANSQAVREKLVSRSRYETSNNGYSKGVTATYATDLVGKGPSLRMTTNSPGFNQMVENEFGRWAKAIQLRRKLWTASHAFFQDGEGMAVVRRNNRINHPIKLDVRLYETEQFQSPWTTYEEGQIDGIKFDDAGNPEYYDLLRHHPGATGHMNYGQDAERIPAEYVLHWFKMERPGQHRGIPANTSTLNTGAAARRWRESVLSSSELLACFTLFLKSGFQPDEMDSPVAMSTLDIMKGMITSLPDGMDVFQPKAEQPTATHAEFSKSLISEQARPKSMPYNKAACDSSGHNFASGKLDHLPYYAVIDNDRDDCVDTFLDPMFRVWFRSAVVHFGWLGGNPDALSEAAFSHSWDWPRHQVFDVKSQATADDTNLKNGSVSLGSLASAAGNDYEDVLIEQAKDSGMSVEDQRKYNILINTPQHAIPAVERLLGLAKEPETETPEPAESA